VALQRASVTDRRVVEQWTAVVFESHLGFKRIASTNSPKFVLLIYLGSQTYPSLEPAGLWLTAARRQGSLLNPQNYRIFPDHLGVFRASYSWRRVLPQLGLC